MGKNPDKKKKDSRLIASEVEDTTLNTSEKTLKSKIIYGICLVFALYGIYSNSFLLMDSLKKAGIFVATILLLIFLSYPSKGAKDHAFIRYLDYFLGVVAFYSAIRITFILDRLGETNLKPETMDLVIGGIALIMVVEATRRCVGTVMAILPIIFTLYALFGQYIPGALGHYGISLKRFVLRMTMTSDGIYGMTTNVAASYIFLFILFGALLNKSGTGEFFTDVANKLAGKSTGGPAKVAVISSGLMGMISGSAAANVATTGAFTIPMMKKNGFKPSFAGAVESVASTGGMIMPPIMGSAAFIMASYLSATYTQIMSAAIIPAILYYISCFCWVHFMAGRLGLVSDPNAKYELTDLKRRIFLFAPLVAIIVALIMGYTAIFAAFIGMIVCIVASEIQKKRMSFRDIIDALSNGARSSLSASIACIVAGIIVGVCNMTGLGATITYNIVNLSGGHLFIALLLTMLASIILSMGLPATACYIVVATVIAPALVNMGCSLFSAHFFVFYFSCLSNITPPVAIASYTAAGIAHAKPWDVGVQSMAIAAPGFLIPFMFAYQPMLLAQGIEIVPFIGCAVTALIGVVFLAAAGAGKFRIKLPVYIRLLYGIGSLLLIVPETITDIVGIALIVVAIIIETALKKAGKEAVFKKDGSWREQVEEEIREEAAEAAAKAE